MDEIHLKIKMEKKSENEKIRKLLIRARNYAISRRNTNDADDFAQEAYLARARGRQGTISQLYTDYLRKYYGDTRSCSGSRESFERHVRVSTVDRDSSAFLERNDFSSGSSSSGLPECERATWRNRIDMGRISKKNKSLETVWELCIEKEISQRDVGEILGIDESRVSQIMTEIKKRVNNAMIIDQMIDEYNDFEEKSQFKIDWITI